MSHRKKGFTGPDVWCHICGYYIPQDIADPRHPLYATVDHVIPFWIDRDASGVVNRRAAHQLCNQEKANRALTLEIADACRSEIKKLTNAKPHLFPSRRLRHAALTLPIKPHG
jgi:hypothetical protein